MDTLTHALTGALAGRATGGASSDPGSPSLRVRGWLGFAAAVFPDIDWALRLVDPVAFLAWHRGVTHSLLLLPLWALLIGGVAWRVLGRRHRLRSLVAIAALGLGVHIAGDAVTAYGTRILAPVSDLAPAPGWVLVIDPWLSACVLAAWLISVRVERSGVALAGLGALVLLVAVQAGLNAAAHRLGEREALARGWPDARVRAFAQPFSPLHRAVLIERDDVYWRARVDLLGKQGRQARPDAAAPVRLYRSYRAPSLARWERLPRWPAGDGARALAREAWASPALEPFRSFAHHPAWYRTDGGEDGTACVWFTDLRYAYDPLPVPFRFGACRDDGADPWRLERLPVTWGELIAAL